MFLRPTRSEVVDHTMRPSMFESESNATNPPAATAATGVEVPAKKSPIIGAAFSRMPMPAVTLHTSTIHRHQNCGVLTAFFAETWAVEISARVCWAAGVQPAGFQSGPGTRTSSTPSAMNTA